MDRRERRRRARERKRLEDKLRREGIREGIRLETERRSEETRIGRVIGVVKRAFTPPKMVGGLVVALLTVVGGWAAVRPHISVEPYLPLNPVDPYSTQFTVKNENSLFDAHDINCVCWPRKMESGNGFSVLSLGMLPNVHHEIRVLKPGASSTVDCPSVIGGVGSYSGQVLYAELEIVVSYSQSWWPSTRTERFPFVSKRDVQGAVHWVHITPEEEKPILPMKR